MFTWLFKVYMAAVTGVMFSSSPLEVLQLHRVPEQLQELGEGRRLLVVPEQLLLRHLTDTRGHTATT